MTKNSSRKLSEVFFLIISQVIRMHRNFSEWEVCRTRRGMRILFSQVIQIHFGEWEVVFRPRRAARSFKGICIDIQANNGFIINDNQQCLVGEGWHILDTPSSRKGCQGANLQQLPPSAADKYF